MTGPRRWLRVPFQTALAGLWAGWVAIFAISVRAKYFAPWHSNNAFAITTTNSDQEKDL